MKGAGNKGFTIVELLIVVVVIAILAAITIVSFNGIQGRAHDAVVKSDLATLKKKIEIYKTDSDLYPNGLLLPAAVAPFRAAKGSYATRPTTDHNLIYCMSTDKMSYAIAAYSKSGTKYVVTNSTPVAEYNNTWTDQTVACEGAVTNYSSNLRGYAAEDTSTGPWRSWTGSN